MSVARERWSRLRLKPSIEEHRGLGGPGGKGAVVSPEIETYTQHGMHLGDVVVARERWSRLRLKQQYQVAFLDTAYVARERWSRLRLKPARSSAFFDNFGGGKGAVVSPEIETCRSKKDAPACAPWQGSGGLA